MSRILLVFEDYTQLANLQIPLKKIGFDVVGITNEFSISGQILAFNPDIVIGYGRSGKVTTIGVGRRLKETPRWPGKVILVFPPGFKPDPQDLIRIRMDSVMEAPVDLTKLIHILASMTGQDGAELIDRLIKSVSQQDLNSEFGNFNESGQQGPIYVSGSNSETEDPDSQSGSRSGRPQGSDDFTRVSISPEAPSSAKARSNENSGDNGDVNSNFTQVDLSTDKVQQTWQVGAGEVAEKDIDALRKELSKAEEDIERRVAKYENIVEGIAISNNDRLEKKRARQAAKDLEKSLDTKRSKSQDQLRREFTKVLFHKKK